MKIEIDAIELAGVMSDDDVDVFIAALSKTGRVHSAKAVEQMCEEAADSAEEDARIERDELLSEIRDLILSRRSEDDILLLIERTMYPRRPRPTDAIAVAA